MDQQTPNQENIMRLLKKVTDSTATNEEKAAALKKLNTSLEEFGFLIRDLRQTIQEEKM
ncbi:MAG: hypothetical protein HYT65_02190 [Candidatus Yanofskybacteria bacterium]|nr:hypothetical protein [Candidatus Yanofskybacteria bacterium]